MKYMNLLLLFAVNSEKIIKNINIPSCKNCVHYKPGMYNLDFTSTYNKCEKFGEKDVITDKITYNYATTCRAFDSMCGKEGKYFEEDSNVNAKIIMHKFTYFVTLVLPLSCFIILYLYALTYEKHP